MNALWLDPDPLVLASASSARAGLLAGAGIPFIAVPARVDERALQREHPGDNAGLAQMLAQAKAEEVAARYPGRLVLGCDQTLDLAGAALHKPDDRAAARAQLLRLRGKAHRLASAMALVRDGVVLWRGLDGAELTMRSFSDDFLDIYLHHAGEALCASVGGYRLEELGVHLFDRVDGAHSTILGLPLPPLLRALRQIGALAA